MLRLTKALLKVSRRCALAAVELGMLSDMLVRLSRRAGQKQTVVINSLLSRLADALLNVKLLKTMRREDRIAPLIEADTERLQKALRKQVQALRKQARKQEQRWWGMRRRYVNKTGDHDSGLWIE